ncbi:MAG: DUF3634 family protein [Sandaracinaceae bacterium]|jgi:hypothetical protein|nr:DUF3634 family protein [Sandaracinaceae bacterium]
MDLVSLLVLVVIAAIALAFLSRANELFCISVKDGRLLVVRGAVPQGLLLGLKDVIQRDRVKDATIRAVKADGHARLVAAGVADGTAQRLRNVFGTHPIQKLRAAPAPKAKNLGQVLGVAWLAWMLLGRRGPDA